MMCAKARLPRSCACCKRRRPGSGLGAVQAAADLPGITPAAGFDEALSGADAIVLLVAHTEFRNLVPAAVAAKMPGRVAVDTVNAWDAATWRQAGFAFHRLGAPSAA